MQKKSRSGQLDLDGHGDEKMMGLTSPHTCICATYTSKQPVESRGNGTFLRPTGHDGHHSICESAVLNHFAIKSILHFAEQLTGSS
jgi:hypothetical protein